QRLMAAVLLRASATTYLSTPTWTRYLGIWGPASAPMIPIPVPSTVPVSDDPGGVASWRRRFEGPSGDSPVVGHFGTYGDHLERELSAAIPAILHAEPRARFVCVGRGSDR